jgi:hypothetical protein
MRSIRIEKADATKLRAELAQQGLDAVMVSGPDAQGVVTVTVPDDVDGSRVDLAVRRHTRLLLSAALRQAKTVAEVRDAVAAALDALL